MHLRQHIASITIAFEDYEACELALQTPIRISRRAERRVERIVQGMVLMGVQAAAVTSRTHENGTPHRYVEGWFHRLICTNIQGLMMRNPATKDVRVVCPERAEHLGRYAIRELLTSQTYSHTGKVYAATLSLTIAIAICPAVVSLSIES